MSNENEFVASLNRLESLIDSNQTDLKRDVESLIDRRFSSLKEEVNKLKCAQSALDQINNLMALWDDRHEPSDLPNRIRTILEGVTANNHDLDSSEVGDNVTVEPTNNLGENELGTEEHVNCLDTNVPSTSTVNDQNLNSSTSANEQVNGHSSNHVPSEPLPTSSSTIPTNIKTEDASNGQQSVKMCKRVKMEQDAQYITDSDSDSDCDSIYDIVKLEIKEEVVETGQLDPDNGQSVQIWTQVKKVEETSDDENVEVQVALDGGKELNDNRNDDLHEESNGTNQGSANDQPVDKGDHGPNEPVSDGQNESSSTSKLSKTRKRRRTGKSLVTENSSFENSLTSGEVSSPGPMTNSKRTRVSRVLDRTESVQEASTAVAVDERQVDEQIGGRGGGGLEQIDDDDDETELGEEEEGGHYRIEVVKLKCTEDGCEEEVADREELHRHLRIDHLISSPHRCLAVGCNERFEQWTELGNHVFFNHSNISTWLCLHCTKTFKSQNCLYRHLNFFHYEGQFKCGYDGCHYDQVATLRSEIRNHQQSVHPKTTNPTIFTCLFNNCGKSFNHKGKFNCHQRIHRKVKPYKCTWKRCGHAAIHLNDVVKHIRAKHFHLPTLKKQIELGIEDNRNPRDYILKELDNSRI